MGGHLLDAACERVQAVVRLLKNIEGMCSSILESVKAVMKSEPALFLEAMRRADVPTL